MEMRTIVFMQQLPKEYEQTLETAAPGWTVVAGDDRAVWLPHLKEAEIVCGWKPEVAERCLHADTKLKWVQTWGAGVDRLPLEAMSRYGIAVTSASGVHPQPVSETAFAMMLAFSRRLHLSIRNQMQRSWQSVGGLSEIHGKTIGVIGVGAIGAEIARIAKAFDMNVLGVRRSGGAVDGVDRVFDWTGLNAVLKSSDYVVSILPLTPETGHLFGREQFRRMKRSAYFINVGRGPTVHTEALIEALEEGMIAGAGLDVFEQEPLPGDNPLWGMDNVIMTPHNGGGTDRYYDRAMRIFLTNLEAYLQGEAPSLNRVDPIKLY